MATQRAVAALEEIERHAANNAAVATHGNLLTLLLRHFDPRVGFADWQALANPDIFRVAFGAGPPEVRRVPVMTSAD
jgi:2,3-bisphosphoglycerate-dependent phosphoglycerate mutase